MMRNLSSAAADFEPIAAEGASISYLAAMPLANDADGLLRSLVLQIPWRSEEIVLWGKRYPQPRLIAWFGDAASRYTYSGTELEPQPWNTLLLSIRKEIGRLTGAKFNSVLLNYYRDQHDSMGFHSDDEAELGPCPVIASVSLGEPRTLVFKHKKRKDLPLVKLPLASGSLLVMAGDTQRNWKHGIHKERRTCGPRVNLTFRTITAARQHQGGQSET